MELENFKLKELKGLAGYIPCLKGLLNLALVKTYDEFITTLYDDIDEFIGYLEDSRRVTQQDSEDRMTNQIVSNFKTRGYYASHETQVGGHCDILVEHLDFRWIGEAKIHSNYAYLDKGFQQLTTRYTTGKANQNHGGLLVYIKKKNALSIMNRWEKEIKSRNSGVTTYKDDCKNLSFFSKHIHETSGNEYITKHLPVLLHFDPKDVTT